MNIKLSFIRTWCIGTYAKAKYFTVKKQNTDDIYNALRDIVYSYKYNTIASFSTDVTCNDNPDLNGRYRISLYFNSFGDTFLEASWNSKNLFKLRNKDIEKYYAVKNSADAQDLFKAIADTREFKQFARKATKNIQNCFKEVIEPLYRGELRVSDELELDRYEITEEDEREAIKNLMRLKGKIVSSSTSNLSKPEFENM